MNRISDKMCSRPEKVIQAPRTAPARSSAALSAFDIVLQDSNRTFSAPGTAPVHELDAISSRGTISNSSWRRLLTLKRSRTRVRADFSPRKDDQLISIATFGAENLTNWRSRPPSEGDELAHRANLAPDPEVLRFPEVPIRRRHPRRVRNRAILTHSRRDPEVLRFPEVLLPYARSASLAARAAAPSAAAGNNPRKPQNLRAATPSPLAGPRFSRPHQAAGREPPSGVLQKKLKKSGSRG